MENGFRDIWKGNRGAVRRKMYVCKKCGTEFEGNFCPMCGTGLFNPDSAEVTLSSYEDAEKAPEAETEEDFGKWSAINTKEKNVLEHVKMLLLCGGFSEAERYLTDIEKEEVSKLGRVSAAVYYYKILARYRASSDDELVRKLVRLRKNLKSDTDYRMAQLSYDCGYKDRINAVEKKIEKSHLTGAKNIRGGKRSIVAGAPRRTSAVLSAVSVCCMFVGIIFWIVGLASFYNFWITTSFIIVLVLCVASFVLSLCLVITRWKDDVRMKALNISVISVSALFIILNFVFYFTW